MDTLRQARGTLVLRVPGIAKPRSSEDAVVALLKKGNAWFARLQVEGGNVLARIAQENGVTRSHVARVVWLGLLAPKLQESLAWGRHPRVTARMLLAMVPLPDAWSEQEAALAKVG